MGVDDVDVVFVVFAASSLHAIWVALPSVCVCMCVFMFGLGLSFNFGLAQKVKAAKNKKKTHYSDLVCVAFVFALLLYNERKRERGQREEVKVDRPNSGQIHKKIKTKCTKRNERKEERGRVQKGFINCAVH